MACYTRLQAMILGVRVAIVRLAVVLAMVSATWVLSPGAGAGEQAATGGRIRIDFRALSSDGTPVGDLAAREVVVRVAGRPRTVSSLEFFESARAVAATPSVVAAPYVSSDDPGPSADVFLAIDDVPAGGAPSSLLPAVDALLGALAPSDRVGLFRLRPGGTSMLPSQLHQQVRAAAVTLAARSAADCVAGQAAETLATLLRARVDAAPAILAVFTGGGAEEAEPGSGCGLRAGDAARIEEAARGRAVFLYFVYSEPTVLPEGLERVARSTGGGAIVLGSDVAGAMRRLARQTAGFHVATFDIDSGERDGSTRPLEIRVERSGTVVAARDAVVMPPGGRPVPALTPRDILRSGMPYRAFPIRAAAYPSSNYDGRVKMVVLFEPIDPSASVIAASFAVSDLSGRVVAQSTASAEDLARRPAVVAFVVSPGRYRLRAAATDAARRGGTLEMDLHAELPQAGPVRLSGLILGGPDVLAFSPRLEFADEPAAVAYLEMYDVPGGATAAVRFEISRTPDGPVLESMPAMLPPSSTPGRIATAAVPIAGLSAGDYIVRARVSVEGEAVGEAKATLRKR